VPESLLSQESYGFSSLLADEPARFLTPYLVREVVFDWMSNYASSTAVDDWMTYPETEDRLDYVTQDCLANACRAEAVDEPEPEPTE
jgi:hypothetical protein